MVHDQLADQKIFFPAKGAPGFDAKEFPGLQQYAGQMVDSGPKAKAYANQYIATHLKAVAGARRTPKPAPPRGQTPRTPNLPASADPLPR